MSNSCSVRRSVRFRTRSASSVHGRSCRSWRPFTRLAASDGLSPAGTIVTGRTTTFNAGVVKFRGEVYNVNYQFQPGNWGKFEVGLEATHTGLLTTSLIGSSINPTTGDYSRGASGFWVERGEITHAVNEVTVAGNLRDMLLRITPANDARAHLSTRVPSLLVEGLTLAGA